MKPTSNIRKNIALTGASLLGAATIGTAATAKTAFEKDRAAILAMAGKFKVTFNFHETYSVKSGYEVKKKAYKESAYEIVKVVEDSGKRIVLQHLLQVDDGLEEMVVKHWGQVWTFEDPEILEYQQGTTWKKKTLSADEAKGTWSQYVTQTDDTPRYESYGKWDHTGGTSIWISQPTPRPLPRREYSKRKDYDVLMGINTHAITPDGWIHEQANRKLVKRDGKQQYLCAERGFNTYEKAVDHDFALSDNYWKTNREFWKNIRGFWNGEIAKSDTFTYTKRVGATSLGKTIRSLATSKKGAASADEIAKAIQPFLAK